MNFNAKLPQYHQDDDGNAQAGADRLVGSAISDRVNRVQIYVQRHHATCMTAVVGNQHDITRRRLFAALTATRQQLAAEVPMEPAVQPDQAQAPQHRRDLERADAAAGAAAQ